MSKRFRSQVKIFGAADLKSYLVGEDRYVVSSVCLDTKNRPVFEPRISQLMDILHEFPSKSLCLMIDQVVCRGVLR